ncbi:MAG: hypothetical protein CFE45_35880, partial [Burkholderiales bacterium PBB5]
MPIPAGTPPSPLPPAPPPPAKSSVAIWVTLRHPAFRTLWWASAIYFIANAMHGMAASWLMVELTGSSFLAALVQTAVFLPMFVLALPAGVLADTTNRQHLILGALAMQAASVLLLAVLLLLGWAGPATILALTFVAGCCTAMLSPAWNAVVGDILPRDELPQAIVTMSIAYNAARALGPTLAGLIYGLARSLALDTPPLPADADEAAAISAVSAAGGGHHAGLVGGGAVLALALGGTLVLAWAML